MSAKRPSDSLRTWIEIDRRAAKDNYDVFRNLIGPKVKLWSVVKSNAYGHGLYAFAKLANKFGVDGFCVDSVVEGAALRRNGIGKPILVLGPTLPLRYAYAAKHDIAITISNFEALNALVREKRPPEFHIKIDTGMHRQGFYLEDIPKVIRLLNPRLSGIYTHFAAAKDLRDTAYTEKQFEIFKSAAGYFERAGFTKLVRHASATGGALLGPRYHLDAVRVGIGLHGVWPSPELARQLGKKITLEPTLAWRAVVSEVKTLKKGDRVGYDLTARAPRDMSIAVIPVGYWHGFPRALSNVGEVLIRGARAKVLGRVSMDLIVVAAPRATKPGAIATLIGRDGRSAITADETAKNIGTTAYELLTRLNPLMERVAV